MPGGKLRACQTSAPIGYYFEPRKVWLAGLSLYRTGLGNHAVLGTEHAKRASDQPLPNGLGYYYLRMRG
jgi:hypothetical protein